jgi:hypothetical protein
MTRRAAALSTSPFAADLLAGPRRCGTAVGARYALVGDEILAVTPPGELRMPNGIEADLSLSPGEPLVVGNGELRTATVAIMRGSLWDSRPHPRFRLSLSPRPQLRFDALAGRGPGLTPLGDDILVGFLAAAALGGADPDFLAPEAERAGRSTTALSRTLLRLSARGHLPEAAHRLLEQGDPNPLLAFGATSGKGIAVGLSLLDEASAGKGRGRTVEFTLPLGSPSLRLMLVVARRPSRCRADMHYEPSEITAAPLIVPARNRSRASFAAASGKGST